VRFGFQTVDLEAEFVADWLRLGYGCPHRFITVNR
jgi:hypothetical protein